MIKLIFCVTKNSKNKMNMIMMNEKEKKNHYIIKT